MPTQAEIAKALNVSTRVARDYIARGCPTSSLEAARDWKAENVRPRFAEQREESALAAAEANDYASEAALRRLPAALARAGLGRKQVDQVLDDVLEAHLAALHERGDPDAQAANDVLRAAIEGAR